MRVTDFPLLTLVISLVVLWLAAQLGVAVGRAREARGWKEPEELNLVLTTSLTLLALIIGFTFSMSVSRYDQRKNYEEEEANAIGTEYLRAYLLPADDAASVRQLLSSYLDQRIEFYKTSDSTRLKQIEERTTQLQWQMWSLVQHAAVRQPNPLMGLTAAGMNDALNSQGYTQAAWRNRIPPEAWLLMLVIAVLCNLLLGYAVAGKKRRGRLLIVLPLLVSVAFFLIADIDAPRGGVIRVSAENLLSLSQQLASPAPFTPQQ